MEKHDFYVIGIYYIRMIMVSEKKVASNTKYSSI